MTPDSREGDQQQKVTFLGVGTSLLPEAVAAQLPVEKGTGLLVTFVAKDSPAEKAGLAPNDVLVRLDEHILVNAAQLQTVIENRKEGDPAKLVFYRKGQEQTASATLASQERSVARRTFYRGDWSDPAHTAEFESALVEGAGSGGTWREAAERGRQAAELGKRAAEFGREAAERGRLVAESSRGEAEKEKGDWAMSMAALKEALKGIDLPSGGLTTTFTKPGSAQALTVDHEGIFLLSRKENTLHLRVTDKTGKVRFDGDVTTPQERSKVPPELAPKLQNMLKDFPADADDRCAACARPCRAARAARTARAARCRPRRPQRKHGLAFRAGGNAAGRNRIRDGSPSRPELFRQERPCLMASHRSQTRHGTALNPATVGCGRCRQSAR